MFKPRLKLLYDKTLPSSKHSYFVSFLCSVFGVIFWIRSSCDSRSPRCGLHISYLGHDTQDRDVLNLLEVTSGHSFRVHCYGSDRRAIISQAIAGITFKWQVSQAFRTGTTFKLHAQQVFQTCAALCKLGCMVSL